MLPNYQRIHTLSAKGASKLELDGDAWLPLYVQDARQVQARAMLHFCGPSYWKYTVTRQAPKFAGIIVTSSRPWQHAPHHDMKKDC